MRRIFDEKQRKKEVLNHFNTEEGRKELKDKMEEILKKITEHQIVCFSVAPKHKENFIKSFETLKLLSTVDGLTNHEVATDKVEEFKKSLGTLEDQVFSAIKKSA